MKYTIPEGSMAVPCRGCGELIYWITTDRGQKMPLDPDGEPHWGSCVKADQFRHKESEDQLSFEDVLF